MNPIEVNNALCRLQFLSTAGFGIGAAAFSSIAGTAKPAAVGPYRGLPNLPHFAPRAKRVIFLCMSGGPSHLETFDYKPALDKLNGQPMPESYTKGQPIAQLHFS